MPTQTFTTGDDSFIVPAGAGTYDLTFLAGNDTLTINGGDSTVAHMDEGNDTVTVNALILALPRSTAGLGDDTYNVKVSGVTLIENLDAGTDLVNSSISWVLGANFREPDADRYGGDQRHWQRSGEHHPRERSGERARRRVGQRPAYGNAGADSLLGGGGNDHLYGGTGADAMSGGTGNDIIMSTMRWTR